MYSQYTECTPVKKLVLLGDTGVGKTTFIKRNLTGEFEKKHNPTIGVEVHPLTFYTNKGPITFNVWDTAGDERFKGMNEGCYVDVDCFMIMFDISSNSSFERAYENYKYISYYYPSKPVSVCANKADLDHSIHQEMNNICIISSKSNYQIYEPFKDLVRVLFNDQSL